MPFLHPTPSPQQPFIVEALYLFAPDFHLLSFRESPPTWTSPAPATRQPPPLVSVPHAACLHLLPFTVTVHPPFAALGLLPGTCQPLGGSSVTGTSVSFVPPLHPSCVLLCILASSGSWFLVGWIFAQGIEARAPPLPGTQVPWTSIPPIIGHASAVQDTRTPPLSCCRDPIPLSRKCGV